MKSNIIIVLSVLVLRVCGQPPPHVIKGYLSHEDDKNWYHKQTMSDGTERIHTVSKPNYYISRQIIETNDLPVQVQYVYRCLHADMTVSTNRVTRVKTKKERIKIKLPPPPNFLPPEPGKTDALGQALKRQRLKRQPKPIEDEPKDYKQRKNSDPVISRKVVGEQVINTHASGAVSETKLRRVFSARVKSAPIKQLPGAGASGSAAGKTTTKQQH